MYREKITKAISQIVGVDLQKINNLAGDEDLKSVGLDSFKSIALIAYLEKEFDFEFDYNDLNRETVKCISQIEESVQKYISK